MSNSAASMPLQSKVSVTLLFAIAAFIGLSYLILRILIAPAFDDLEMQAAHSDLVRAEQAIQTDIDNLEADAFVTDGERASTDNGTDSFDQEFSLQLLARDEKTLGEIIEALDRIRSGEFGRCEKCSKWIAKARLEAMPYARKCIACQRAAEAAG